MTLRSEWARRVGRAGLLAAGATLLFAAAIRLTGVAGHALWTDELGTYWVATAPDLAGLVRRAAMTQGMSPFYFLLERLVLAVAPPTEWTIRALSLTASVISVWICYLLGLETFRDRKTALTAAILFAVNGWMIYYGREARPYAVALLFALLSQWAFIRLFRRDRRWTTFAAYAVFSALTVYAHYLFGTVLIAQALFYWDRRRAGCRSAPSFRSWAIGQLAIGALLVPSLVQALAITGARSRWDWTGALTFSGARDAALAVLDRPALIAGGAVALLMVAAGGRFRAFRPLRLRGTALTFYGLWLGASLGGLALASLALGVSLFTDRYLCQAIPPFLFLMAEGLNGCRGSWRRAAPVAAYVLAWALFAAIPAYRRDGAMVREIPHDWRAALREIQTRYRPGDIVLLRTGLVHENWLPAGADPIVRDNARCPFYSPYWSGPPPPIYNLTYTSEPAFAPYLESLLKAAATAERTWIIGVDPPNANYSLAAVIAHVEKNLPVRPVLKRNDRGLFLALFERAASRSQKPSGQ